MLCLLLATVVLVRSAWGKFFCEKSKAPLIGISSLLDFVGIGIFVVREWAFLSDGLLGFL